MHHLSEILDEKGHEVLRIEAEASVLSAVERMVEANVGSLLVTEHGEVVGIVRSSVISVLPPATGLSQQRSGHTAYTQFGRTPAWLLAALCSDEEDVGLGDGPGRGRPSSTRH